MYKRTPETQARYEQSLQDGTTILHRDQNDSVYFDLSEVAIKHDFTHWVIIANDFPYDALFSQHDLLIPKRHFAHIREATNEERHEYYAIKKDIDRNHDYESITENFSSARSVPGHFHSHLIVWKR